MILPDPPKEKPLIPLHRDSQRLELNGREYTKVSPGDIPHIVQAYRSVQSETQQTLYSISSLGLFDAYLHKAENPEDYSQVVMPSIGMYPIATFPYVPGDDYAKGCIRALQVVTCGVSVDIPKHCNVMNLKHSTRSSEFSDLILDPTIILKAEGKGRKNLRNAVNRSVTLIKLGKLRVEKDPQNIPVEDILTVWRAWHSKTKDVAKSTKSEKNYRMAFEFHQCLARLGLASTVIYYAKMGGVWRPVHVTMAEGIIPKHINGTFTFWNYFFVPDYFPEPLWLGIYNDCVQHSPKEGWTYNAQYTIEYGDDQKSHNNKWVKRKFNAVIKENEWTIAHPSERAYFKNMHKPQNDSVER